jgi:hypothetical protein
MKKKTNTSKRCNKATCIIYTVNIQLEQSLQSRIGEKYIITEYIW